MPKVSVVIPAYNALNYLPEALHSVQAQTFTDIEIIIVNDGSVDQTEEWVLCQDDSQIRLISQENLGKSAARNRGIREAQGKYVAFLDADDLWEPTKLQKQVHCLDQHPEACLVYTWTALADEQGELTGRLVASKAEGNVWLHLVQQNILGCGSTPLLRKDVFEVVGGFDEQLPLAQDWEMWIRLAAHYPFRVIKEPLTRYRKHQGNTSANWQMMAQCQTQILAKAFAKHSKGMAHTRRKAYYSAYLFLGKLATRSQDHKQALRFWHQAIVSAPFYLFSPKSLHLLLSLALAWALGVKSLQRLLSIIYRIRRRVKLNRSFD